MLSSEPMGKVRAKVKLTNAVDDELVRRRLLAANEVQVYETEALVDTGAVSSVLPVHVVQQLGLAIRGQRLAEYADGRQEPVGVTGPVAIAWQ